MIELTDELLVMSNIVKKSSLGWIEPLGNEETKNVKQGTTNKQLIQKQKQQKTSLN